MTYVWSSQGAVLATAVAVSGTVILLFLSREKATFLENTTRNQDSGGSAKSGFHCKLTNLFTKTIVLAYRSNETKYKGLRLFRWVDLAADEAEGEETVATVKGGLDDF
ncbi:unnamed protein product [Lactuca saligna]|uniref:Uncharacterized protein n=1 Tax=Lactuca saligna TaxID=75948 RepID=A0AA35Z6Z9_LACSI|nr:unnamed protein product [Lactuca saligna]